jgi:alpha-tubulin suppressor-like RCC1 family protein
VTALKQDGSAWSWGLNGTDGRIGDNTTIDRSSPVSVAGNHQFVMVANGGTGIGLKVDGTAWTWGGNNFGGCGIGVIGDRSSPVSVIDNHSFVEVYGGDGWCLALKEDGTLWSWGNNQDGRLGDGTALNANNKSSPVSVIGNHNFIMASAQYEYALALKSNGEVWSWGDNRASGTLGDGNIVNRSSPVSVLGGTYPGLGTTSGVDIFTAKSLSNVVSGDKLYWNGGVAGFNLDPSLRVDLLYRE